MTLIETTLLLMLAVLLTRAVASDIKDGVVRNKTLTRFAWAALPALVVYYGWARSDLFGVFLLNCGTCVVAAFALFCARLLAGGDCKLLCCASLIFPANCCVSYRGTTATLLLAPMLAFAFGYLFLTARTVAAIARRRTKIDGALFKEKLKRFARNYFRAFVYISVLDLTLRLTVLRWIDVNPLWTLVLYLGVVWASCAVDALKKPLTVAATLAFGVAVALIFQTAPFRACGGRCCLAFAVVFARLLAENANYRKISTSDVRKGTILALETSLRFLNSPIAGLPGVSTESLRSRLTEEEAASVRKWGETAPERAEVVVVQKVLFTIFIALGFVAYWALAVGRRCGWIGGAQ